MKKSTKNIIKYFIEFLIVAFGVFLGVFVSEWNSQNKIDKNTEKTLTYIIEEIHTNVEKFKNTIDYQTTLMEKVDSVVQGLNKSDMKTVYYNNKKFRFTELPNWQGLKFSSLETIVYESAKINGVLQEFNISTTKLIARVYKNQEGYTKFTEMINTRLGSINSETKIIDVLAIFELVKYDALPFEKMLLTKLKKVEEKLKETKHNNMYKQ